MKEGTGGSGGTGEHYLSFTSLIDLSIEQNIDSKNTELIRLITLGSGSSIKIKGQEKT